MKLPESQPGDISSFGMPTNFCADLYISTFLILFHSNPEKAKFEVLITLFCWVTQFTWEKFYRRFFDQARSQPSLHFRKISRTI